jgi:hypothetical protein
VPHENTLGAFTTQLVTENIFKETTGNESLRVHENSNDDGVNVVNFATSTVFHIEELNWTSPYGKTYIQTDWRWHSLTLHVCYFWGADCDTDHCLVVAKLGRDSR